MTQDERETQVAADTAATQPTAEEAAQEAAPEVDGAQPEAEPAVAGDAGLPSTPGTGDVDSSEEALAEAEAEGEPEAEAEAAEPDYKDKYVRAVAELENVRKRARRDQSVAEARGIAKLARELLPALDNFDRALAHAEAEEADDEHHLTHGIRLVQQELLAALTRMGIEPESPDGEPFDPHRHEAVAQQPIEGTEPGIVVQVYQAGYRYGDEILRPAKVVVSG